MRLPRGYASWEHIQAIVNAAHEGVRQADALIALEVNAAQKAYDAERAGAL
jgi:hypothetical protein